MMTTGTNRIERLESFSFAGFPSKPGPLHTIQIDENGCIYYSDELNHSVVSLDSRGNPRWQLAGKGANPAQFHYPRGIALGWILKEGRPSRCLATADSWNRRIQFFRLDDGNYITEWGPGSDKPFLEPVDIRFIPFASSAGSDPVYGYWLVLDKSNHSLLTVDLDGRTLCQWGTSVDAFTAAKWAASGIYPNLEKMDWEMPPKAARYDLLYFPSRILGADADALYLWEPFRLNLKLIAYGNFLPLAMGAFADREWIAADSAGLLEWSRAKNCLNFYDCAGKLLYSDRIEGELVPSNLPSNEFWMQLDDGIQRMKIVSNEASDKKNGGSVQSLLLYTAEEGLKNLPVDTVISDIKPILHVFDQLISLADQVLTALERKESSSNERNLWDEQLRALIQKWDQARSALYADLRSFNPAILQLRLASCSGEHEKVADSSPLTLQWWDRLHKAITGKFAALVQCFDDQFILDLNLARSSDLSGETELSDLRSLAAQVSGAIGGIVEWILKWHGINQRAAMPLAVPSYESNMDVAHKPIPTSGYPVMRKKAETGGSKSILLRELPPLNCATKQETPAAPTYLAMSGKGRLFVSLQKANQIICIDNCGEIQAILGGEEHDSVKFNQPAGITLDGKERLWIADSLNRRILIYEAPYKRENLVRTFEPPEIQLLLPHGLMALGDDDVMVTDPGANSVFSINTSGSITMHFNKLGSELDSVRYPSSFCLDAINPRDYLWLVERRNHRLLKLDSSGCCIKELGSCGLEQGCFFYPVTMAMFSDGMSIVAEGIRYPNLVFLTTEGTEIARLYLDYIAAGMYIQNDLLYVCQYDGNCVRRYARVS